MSTSQTLNLVIVDDDHDDHYLMRDSLWQSEIPFQAVSFYNGQELVDFLKSCNSEESNTEELPDLIILDINMPLLNGVETIKAIQEIPSARSIPVYLVSTCSEPQIPESVLRQAKGFFVKPYSQPEYVTFIQSIFSAHLASEENRAGEMGLKKLG
jgi:CheY-like chemotaxis protein